MSLLADILVVSVSFAVIAAAVVLSVIGRHRAKKKGSSGCSGDCSRCSGCK